MSIVFLNYTTRFYQIIYLRQNVSINIVRFRCILYSASHLVLILLNEIKLNILILYRIIILVYRKVNLQVRFINKHFYRSHTHSLARTYTIMNICTMYTEPKVFCIFAKKFNTARIALHWEL